MKKVIIDGEEETLVDLTPEEIAELAPEVRPILVVTMRQARLALLETNRLHLVQPAIDSLPSPFKEAAEIEWEYSGEVHRNKPFVQSLSLALGLSSTDLDDLFILASTK